MAVDMDAASNSSTNYLIVSLGLSTLDGRGSQLPLGQGNHCPKQSKLFYTQTYYLAAVINHNYHNCVRSVLKQVLLTEEDIKATCCPQQSFLGRSNISSNITYSLTGKAANISQYSKQLDRLNSTSLPQKFKNSEITSSIFRIPSSSCLLYTSPSPRD